MGLFGGSKKTTTPATGFHSQHPLYQKSYGRVIHNLWDLISSDGINADMFTPNLSEQGQAALDKIYAGFTPTEESFAADLAMLQNPFDEYVINDLNRQATGQNSLVNQASTLAGQQGSNRSFLGTSDVEQNRLNSIGMFRQSQYNNAVNQILNGLVPNRRSDAESAFAKDYQLTTQAQQAPLQALMAQAGLLRAIPTEFGTLGTPETTVKTGGGLGGVLGGIGSIASLATGNPAYAMGGNLLSGGGASPQGLASLGSSIFGGRGSMGLFGNIFGNSLGQTVGSWFDKSPMGPYQPFGTGLNLFA